MEIETGTPAWDDTVDRPLWLQFLQTETGKRLIPKVLETCPSLLSGGNVNEILIRSGEVRGFQQVIQAFLALSVSELPPPMLDQVASSYPRLDDDEKWADGQKLNP